MPSSSSICCSRWWYWAGLRAKLAPSISGGSRSRALRAPTRSWRAAAVCRYSNQSQVGQAVSVAQLQKTLAPATPVLPLPPPPYLQLQETMDGCMRP
jgi:hypothetical protein